MSTNAQEFHIKVEGLDLRLKFFRPDEEGWLSVFANVNAGPFTGTYRFSMLGSELEALINEMQSLDQALGAKDADISWENYEGNIEFGLSLDLRGTLQGRYRLAAGLGWETPILSGEFTADQSYLAGWIQQLEHVISFVE